MGLLDYKNGKEILNSNGVQRGVRFDSEDLNLLDGIQFEIKLDTSLKNGQNGERLNHVEFHVYTDTGGLITSRHELSTWQKIERTNQNIRGRVLLDVHKDIRDVGLTTGNYKVVYNFFRNHIGSFSNTERLFVAEISPSRRELRLKLTNPESNASKLQLQEFIGGMLQDATFTKNLVLNFGDNKILPVIGVGTSGLANEFAVKLYEPLPKDIDINYSCWIATELIRPYVDSIILIPTALSIPIQTLRGPNTQVDYDYWITTETDFKNWNDLLGENASSTQELLDRYFSGSLSGIELNINYSEFSNFIHFSSAEERVNNFVYKKTLLEYYDSQLAILDSATGSLGTNRTILQKNRTKVISGFDGFERWLYYGITGSLLYTYPGSSSYGPWPKVEVSGSATGSADFVYSNSYYKLLHSTSSVAIDWNNDILERAVEYDAQNYSALHRTIPEFLRDDDSNDQYVLFVNMIGQHFDILHSYIRHLSEVHTREENPKSGVSNDLVYDLARNMGWTLTNSNKSSDLWRYALNVDDAGDPIHTTSDTGYDSKSHAVRVKEVWRRILNNLPYILKTKGTSRSIRALLSCYGIPSTLISIREYGGGNSPYSDSRPRFTLDKYTHYLRFSGSLQGTSVVDRGQYVKVPWGPVFDPTPSPGTNNAINGVELRLKFVDGESYSYENNNVQTVFQIGTGSTPYAFLVATVSGSVQGKGNLTFALRDASSSVYRSASIENQYFFDGEPINVVIQRNTVSNNIATSQTYTLYAYKEFAGRISLASSASFTCTGSFNTSWHNDNFLYLGSGSNPLTNKSLSGSVFELRYWQVPLTTSAIENHTLFGRAYNNGEPTSSYDTLYNQYKFWQKFDAAVTTSISSSHPAIAHINAFQSGQGSVAQLYNFTSKSFESVVETYTMDVVSLGANAVNTSKVRIEDSTLLGELSPSKRVEYSSYDKNSLDSNRVMVAFSPQHLINEDVFEQYGDFRLDDYIGDPQDIYNEGYTQLKWLSRQYWQKYENKNDFVAYIRLISAYDFSLFQQIKQLLPLRANAITGLVIEPNVLERNKVKTAVLPVVYSPRSNNFDTRMLSASVVPSAEYTQRQITTIRIQSDLDGEKRDYEGDVNYIVPSVTASKDLNAVADVDVEPFRNVTLTYNAYRATVDARQLHRVSGLYKYFSDTIFELDFHGGAKTYPQYEYVFDTSSADVGHGFNWTKRLIAEWKLGGVYNIISGGRSDGFLSTTHYFYSGSSDIINQSPYSQSYRPADRLSPYKLPTSIRRARFEGCKLSGQSINVDSLQTTDGGPVVSVQSGFGNQLVYSQNNISGSLIL